ncbi:dynein beta chain, ciliary protein [Wolffia australiana]
MGQALRRAAGRVRSKAELGQPIQNAEHRAKPPLPPGQEVLGIADFAGQETVVEERDPAYDAMLNKMVGRISSKPGGKLEMGEAHLVDRYSRPMPKLRSTTAAPTGGGEKSPPRGTLEAVHLRQILLLYEGKSDDHRGPMPVDAIAEKFNLDPAQLRTILQFISLPPDPKVNDKS